MSITLGNPIVITSGQFSSPITRTNICIEKLYWFQPNTSGSGVVLRKGNLSGAFIAEMRTEVSGQSQTLHFPEGKWVNDLYCECVGAGTLYIHTK
jgi:hypothetical protein